MWPPSHTRAREDGKAMRTEAMGSYRGPARVITDGGEVYNVTANLSSTIQRERVGDHVIEGLTDWGGYLTGNDVPWFKIGETGEAITVVVGDREGTAWVRRFNVASPDGPVTILGSSPPPFDSGTGLTLPTIQCRRWPRREVGVGSRSH
jgi:hypothetical protein